MLVSLKIPHFELYPILALKFSFTPGVNDNNVLNFTIASMGRHVAAAVHAKSVPPAVAGG